MKNQNRQKVSFAPPVGTAVLPGGFMAPGGAGHLSPNRCAACGRFVGEKFAGFEHDRMSDRGRLWCERCVVRSMRRAGK
jgi:hypothetical protein